MKAEIVHEGEVMVVRLEGYLDYETIEPFRRICLERLRNEKVIFDMKSLSFIGSSGITNFMDILLELSQQNHIKPKFYGLTSEFKKIFAASSLRDMDAFDHLPYALDAFRSPEIRAFPHIAKETLWVEEDDLDSIE